jgi:hypothetical protein
MNYDLIWDAVYSNKNSGLYKVLRQGGERETEKGNKNSAVI